MSLVAKKAMNGWRPTRNGCEFTVIPDKICSVPMTLRASDISKRRESIICSTDGGERRGDFGARFDYGSSSATSSTAVACASVGHFLDGHPQHPLCRRRVQVCLAVGILVTSTPVCGSRAFDAVFDLNFDFFFESDELVEVFDFTFWWQDLVLLPCCFLAFDAVLEK